MKEILKGPSLIFYMVRSLKEKIPTKQVGKTILQKLMYLFGETSGKEFDYTLYHYGPYSFKVSEYINLAESLGFIEVTWEPNRGYFIKPLNSEGLSFIRLEEEEKRMMDDVINRFGQFTANELSIIATAIYIKNNFNVTQPERLVEAISSLKPRNEKNWIKSILQKAGIINDTH